MVARLVVPGPWIQDGAHGHVDSLHADSLRSNIQDATHNQLVLNIRNWAGGMQNSLPVLTWHLQIHVAFFGSLMPWISCGQYFLRNHQYQSCRAYTCHPVLRPQCQVVHLFPLVCKA